MKAGLLLLIVLGIALPCAMANGVAGTWEGQIVRSGDTLSTAFDLDIAGDKVTGAGWFQGWYWCEISGGHVEGDRFRFTVRSSGASKVEFDGSVVGNSMMLAAVDGSGYAATLHRVESQVTGPVSEGAAPKELEGKWTAHFVGPIRERPKMIGQIDFDLQVDGNTVTGMAHMKGWPGDCPISDGKIANGRFSFTATGLAPSSSGIPVLRFDGEIHGKQLKLTMHHQIFGSDNGTRLPMDAARP